jgi:hypothetical protein
LLQLAVQILSLSSPLADAAAILAAATVLVNSLRRRMRIAAKHPPARSTNIRDRLAAGSPPVDRMAGGAVDVSGNVALVPVTGRQRSRRLEHHDGATRRGRLVLHAPGDHEDVTGADLRLVRS